MKGIRFYEEFENKRKRQSQGNVIAVFTDTGRASNGGYMFDAMGAVYFQPDSPVASTGVSWDYLREKCKHISEKQARQIHPQLFTRLDD